MEAHPTFAPRKIFQWSPIFRREQLKAVSSRAFPIQKNQIRDNAGALARDWHDEQIVVAKIMHHQNGAAFRSLSVGKHQPCQQHFALIVAGISLGRRWRLRTRIERPTVARKSAPSCAAPRSPPDARAVNPHNATLPAEVRREVCLFFPESIPPCSWQHNNTAGLTDKHPKMNSTSNIEHRTSNIEHRTSNIEHRTSNIERNARRTTHDDIRCWALDVGCSMFPPS